MSLSLIRSAAILLGRRGGLARAAAVARYERAAIARSGGRARAAALGAGARRQIARAAVRTRWEAVRNARRIEENFLRLAAADDLRIAIRRGSG